MTIENIYIKYICSICNNKETDLCEIRRRYDNTLFCVNYSTDIVKKKKQPVNWQKW